ncbi:hypothetical protein [Mesonia sp. K4-1]|uniref:hypothetical protein n=1 Tax=Mesonia sp. K4-1 TaxID=2602760 RepID=UPI0011C8809F|nr:hypothetical protein [Mesonia sp. K4-1]TXK72156.1 hypothetical protein FT986_14565 [Mesonia sp. K4-1]
MKNIKLIFIALFASTLATSCLVDDDVPRDFGQSPTIVGFESSSATESYFSDEGAILREYTVVLLGKGGDGSLPEEDITITYEVNSAESTATEGQEFDFVDSSGQFVIPAGSTFALFPLNVNTGGLNPDSPTQLVLDLTGTTSEGAVVSELDKRLIITFVGCESNLGDFTYFNPNAGNAVTFTPTDESPVIFEVSALPYLTSGGNPIPFLLNDVCGDIVIDSPVLGGAYRVIGDGEVNDDGSVTIRYALYQAGEIFGDFDYREQPSTYIPN